jgi:hypothetical protein
LKKIYHEVYGNLRNNEKLKEQLTLESGKLNITTIALRAVFKKRVNKPSYPAYKDYITDESYWTVIGRKIVNTKPVIFPCNNSLNVHFINYIWLSNEFNTIKIECKLTKPTYLNHDEAVVFDVNGIYILIK